MTPINVRWQLINKTYKWIMVYLGSVLTTGLELYVYTNAENDLFIHCPVRHTHGLNDHNDMPLPFEYKNASNEILVDRN